MNDNELNDLRQKLRSAIPPPREPELKRDLWPSMLARLNEPQLRVPWYDWLLAAAAAAVLIFFPGAIPAVLYHL